MEKGSGFFYTHGLNGSIGFSTDYASEQLQDEYTRKEFWRCFKILAQVEASPELQAQEYYRCAC